MPTRMCPKCRVRYGEQDTNCTRCGDVPAALAPGTDLVAQLMLADWTAAFGLSVKRQLGVARYRVEQVLGYGGMATAYKVLAGNQTLVVKEIRPNSNQKVMSKMQGSFLREAEIQYNVGLWMTTKPPSFTPLPKGYGAFVSFGRLYMAMDYMEGDDFDKIQDRTGGPLPLLEVVQMGMEMSIILRDYLHGYTEGGVPHSLIHRDIKPANIIRLRWSKTACLLDYGIARPKELSFKTLARGGTRAGSEAFAAPEFDQKGVAPTLSLDTYSLCASMWSLLVNAKELPGTRDLLLRSIRTIPNNQLQQVLFRGTEDDPSRRYQTAEELRRDLERVYVAQRPLPQHLVSTTAPQPLTQQPTVSSVQKIVLPDKRVVELRAGEEFSIARSDTGHQVTLRVDDKTVSSTPIRIVRKGNDLFVTGGGSSGFAIVETRRYPATESIKLPRMQNPRGGSTRLSVTVGKDTKLVVE